eukprot:TRINITY_DN4299_c0_g1_i4.p1 TRINITY_DN4299_c0_g1~~TRINITY_DN4299_c0_g1_i4.p1  ORF type:complete len:619 (-),score=259.77 TRINITY_DN4299_c0_g1_i4:96-1952(-)
MPPRVAPSSLYSLSCQGVACLLLKGCQALDKRWEEPSQEDQQMLLSPDRGAPLHPPDREEVYLQLSPAHRTILDWLVNLPDRVVEEVVVDLLAKVEVQLLEDKDQKLIMSIINIEKMKISDFFFGVHSLLSLVQGFEIQSLKFSRRLMFCLWEYGEIANSKLLMDTMCSSLPGLSSLTSLNIPHISTDRLLYVVSKHLPNLIFLDLSSSRVTDRGVRYLAGANQVTYVTTVEGRNVNNVLDTHKEAETSEESGHEGCSKLEHINLQSCEWVTEKGLRFLLEHLTSLKRVEYHQRSSLMEVMIKWASTMTEEQQGKTVLNLIEVEHGFPYGLSPLSEHMTKLSVLIPNLTNITLVTDDKVVDLLAMFPHLKSIKVELEDCLGEGFIHLLEKKGSQLEEISVSCSSDPEASLSLDQMEGREGQQGQLFNLATVCVGLLARGVKKLSVSGCGLVSSAAVRKMKLQDKIGNSVWLRRQMDSWFQSLEMLILMSYEDNLPSMSIHSGLLKSVLMAAKSLSVLNLEGNLGSTFSDSYLSEIVTENPLSSLRILDICVNDQQGQVGRIPLTLTTVQLLLSKCHCLRELRISDWNISSQHFSEVMGIIKENNWDLLVTRRVVAEGD